MSFNLDQILLVAILIFFIVYVSVLRTTLTDRILYFLFTLIGIVMVINPEWSTRVAHWFGIGRGADMLLYLFIVTALFYTAGLRSELKKMKHEITLLVREIALSNPKEGGDLDRKEP